MASDSGFLAGLPLQEISAENLTKPATDLALKYPQDPSELSLEIVSYNVSSKVKHYCLAWKMPITQACLFAMKKMA